MDHARHRQIPVQARHHRPARLSRRPSSLPAPSCASSPPGSPSSAGACWAPDRCRRARRGARRWRSGRSCRGSAFPPAWWAGRRADHSRQAEPGGRLRARGKPAPLFDRRSAPRPSGGTAIRDRASAQAALADEPRVEAVFLLLPGMREVSRRWFGGFNAVQFEGRQRGGGGPRRGRAGGEPTRGSTACWRRPGRAATGPRLLAVVSAYGVDPPGVARSGQMAPGAALGGEFQGGPDGVLLLYGEGIRPGALLTGARAGGRGADAALRPGLPRVARPRRPGAHRGVRQELPGAEPGDASSFL